MKIKLNIECEFDLDNLFEGEDIELNDDEIIKYVSDFFSDAGCVSIDGYYNAEILDIQYRVIR